ncbi:MAG: hypothetical protein H7833_00845 [Magnetococcus sp. DMHC-1]|nr:hypothetical protein [Magnetococcales bacterium]
MVAIVLSGIGLSLLIGYLGRKKKMGFWGYFFGSILLTPIIGVILLLAADDIK